MAEESWGDGVRRMGQSQVHLYLSISLVLRARGSNLGSRRKDRLRDDGVQGASI